MSCYAVYMLTQANHITGYTLVNNYCIHQPVMMCTYIHSVIHKPILITVLAASPYCDGEASICEAVSSWGLTLDCTSCSSAKEVVWKLGTKELPYKTSVAQIPAQNVEPSDSGCYTCVCDLKSYSFSVDIQAAGKCQMGNP